MADYSSIGHPYCRDYMITSSLTWVLCMSPLMAQLLGEAEFMEADVTYKASTEFQYLFNVSSSSITQLYAVSRCIIIVGIYQVICTSYISTNQHFIFQGTSSPGSALTALQLRHTSTASSPYLRLPRKPALSLKLARHYLG